MQETYTSDFPGMKHRENIRTGYIMTSTAAGSDNQLSGCHNLSLRPRFAFLPLCLPPVFFFFSLLFCIPGFEGGIILNSQRSAEQHASQSAQHSKGRIPGDAVARWVWFVHPSHTSEGWCASLLHWGRASAMFTVMFQGMLRGFKHIKHIYRNTDIGNAMGSPTKRYRHTPENTHAHDCAMSTHKPHTTINLYF